MKLQKAFRNEMPFVIYSYFSTSPYNMVINNKIRRQIAYICSFFSLFAF